MTSVNFNNPTKDNWRRWAWNRHEAVLPHGGTALIMAGTDVTTEVKLGRDRGFSVVCCDINEGNVADARKKGEVAVWDDIKQQILCLRPKAVTLDFMGGLTQKTMEIVVVSCESCCSVVVNMLRGRDLSLTEYAKRIPNKGFPRNLNPKHRGYQLAKILWANFVLGVVEDSAVLNDPLLRAYTETFTLKNFNFKFNSYKSRSVKNATLYYDSVSMIGLRSWGGEIEKEYGKQNKNCLKITVSEKSKRKAAAVKANLRRRRNQRGSA